MPDYQPCTYGYNRTRKECTDWRDDGYERCDAWGNSCVAWAKECVVSWIPIIGPAICKVFEWICTALQAVCTAAVWVAQWVCHAWNVITTFVCLVWATLGPVLAIPAVFVKLIFSIPGIGGAIKQIVNTITSVGIGVVGFVVEGGLCGVFGVCFSKKLRVCVIITNERGQPVATQAQVQPFVDKLIEIYRQEAENDVYAHFDSGGPTPSVDPKCGSDGWLQDLGLYGSQYESSAALLCRDHSFASVIGIGSPIYAFVVRDIQGDNNPNGCSLGPLTNYVLFEPGRGCTGDTNLAHEVGHACNLFHVDDSTNLMNPSCVVPGRQHMSPFQKAVIRGSKYVTYT